MKRLHAFVSGRVQGVFFRAFAKEHADKLSIKGTVHNLEDGRVEIIAEGGKGALAEFLAALMAKHPAARVENIEAEWSSAKNEFKEFRVVR